MTVTKGDGSRRTGIWEGEVPEVFVKIKTKEETGQDPEYLLFGINGICGW
jgi:hypothetical protein